MPASRKAKVNPDDLLDYRTAADDLGISPRTLQRLKASGAIGFCEVRRGERTRVYFLPQHLDEYREAHVLRVVEASA